jgi:hypothetical protein
MRTFAYAASGIRSTLSDAEAGFVPLFIAGNRSRRRALVNLSTIINVPAWRADRRRNPQAIFNLDKSRYHHEFDRRGTTLQDFVEWV